MSDGKDERAATVRPPLAGRIFRWLFIGFNLVMAAWLVSFVLSANHLKAAAVTAADKAAEGDAAAGGAGLLLGIWLFGAVLLGLFASLLKGAGKGRG
jgi:hypothetical protein